MPRRTRLRRPNSFWLWKAMARDMSADCWKPEGVLIKLNESLSSTQIHPEFKRVSLKPSDVSNERLLSAYRLIAEIIAMYGEAYLPIFERLHSEIEELERKNALLDLARTVSESHRP